jgi:hypothetical protein
MRQITNHQRIIPGTFGHEDDVSRPKVIWALPPREGHPIQRFTLFIVQGFPDDQVTVLHSKRIASLIQRQLSTERVAWADGGHAAQ